MAAAEIVDGFDVNGAFLRQVERSTVMRPETSGVYGKSGHVLLARVGECADATVGPIVNVQFAVSVRSRHKAAWPGCYDFTAGGMAKAGESELDAAVREAKEELGIELDRDQLQEIARLTPAQGYHSFGAVYSCAWDGPLIGNAKDIEKIVWLRAEELNSDESMKPDFQVFTRSIPRFFEEQMLTSIRAQRMTDIPTVVHLKRRKGVVVVDCDVYIGRPMYQGGWRLPGSKWANPYRLRDDGRNRNQVLADYEAYVRGKPELLAALPELRGKRLGCWCAPLPCHGNILARLYAESCRYAEMASPADDAESYVDVERPLISDDVDVERPLISDDDPLWADLDL